ncbi:hypothetical protein DFJ43DRAFT_1040304 [Lentinula guzmanii]|uniref:Uncharacterized protein n=1 Tax=Lentinula guzmanii TaxID=2804957 RepID=A0AA38N0C4_9AGAR|nr:hypothetical protein DFJ43DRAFT_1040304 [Lentinula guzmanii]
MSYPNNYYQPYGPSPYFWGQQPGVVGQQGGERLTTFSNKKIGKSIGSPYGRDPGNVERNNPVPNSMTAGSSRGRISNPSDLTLAGSVHANVPHLSVRRPVQTQPPPPYTNPPSNHFPVSPTAPLSSTTQILPLDSAREMRGTTVERTYNSPEEVPAEDPIYPTRDEALLAASLFHYGPGMEENFPDEYDFCIVTGALTGPPELVERLRNSVTPVVPSINFEDSSDDIDDESAVNRAEIMIESASKGGNFEALWKLCFEVFEAQRKQHLERVLAILPEDTSISAKLVAVTQLYSETQLTWATKPIIEEVSIATNNNPWGALKIPRLTQPQLDEPVELHALYFLVHATPKNFPRITWTRSGHVDLATVCTYLMLKLILCDTFKKENPTSQKTRRARQSFTGHFIHLSIIPYMYSQVLQQMEVVVNTTFSVKLSESNFADIREVANHLANCGVSVEAMGSAMYYSPQYVVDQMALLPIGLEKWLQYRDWVKRGIARLQFAQPPESDNRFWELPPAYIMEDILEERRQRFTLAKKKGIELQPLPEYWKFGHRNGLNSLFTATVSSVTAGMASLSVQ